MTDQSKEPRERNNPSQATPQPHPAYHTDFKLRHDQADARPPKIEDLSERLYPKETGIDKT